MAEPTLAQLGYLIAPDGRLRNAASGQLFNLRRHDQDLERFVKALIAAVRSCMLSELGFRAVDIPEAIEAAHPDARCPVYLTNDWRTADRVLLLVAGARSFPGLWSRTVALELGLGYGSMLPYFREAQAQGFAVAVPNPYVNYVEVEDAAEGRRKLPVVGADSPTAHLAYLWDRYLSSCPGEVHVMALGYGAVLIKQLLSDRQGMLDRVKSVVLCESAAEPSADDPSTVLDFFAEHAVAFECDDKHRRGETLPHSSRREWLSPTVSAGLAKTVAGSAAEVACCAAVMDMAFAFMDAAEDGGGGAAAEAEGTRGLSHFQRFLLSEIVVQAPNAPSSPVPSFRRGSAAPQPSPLVPRRAQELLDSGGEEGGEEEDDDDALTIDDEGDYASDDDDDYADGGWTSAGARLQGDGANVNWVKDSAAAVCAKCTAPFSLMRRRHHCRGCGGVFCDDCTQHRRILPSYRHSAHPLRVCEACARPVVARCTLANVNGGPITVVGQNLGGDPAEVEVSVAGSRCMVEVLTPHARLKVYVPPGMPGQQQTMKLAVSRLPIVTHFDYVGAEASGEQADDDRPSIVAAREASPSPPPPPRENPLRKSVSTGVIYAPAPAPARRAEEKEEKAEEEEEAEEKQAQGQEERKAEREERRSLDALGGGRAAAVDTPTPWTAEARVSQCKACDRGFSFLLRKHHCRACGGVVCDRCSPERLYCAGYAQPERTCTPCATAVRASVERFAAIEQELLALPARVARERRVEEQLQKRVSSRSVAPGTNAEALLAQQAELVESLQSHLFDLEAERAQLLLRCAHVRKQREQRQDPSSSSSSAAAAAASSSPSAGSAPSSSPSSSPQPNASKTLEHADSFGEAEIAGEKRACLALLASMPNTEVYNEAEYEFLGPTTTGVAEDEEWLEVRYRDTQCVLRKISISTSQTAHFRLERELVLYGQLPPHPGLWPLHGAAVPSNHDSNPCPRFAYLRMTGATPIPLDQWLRERQGDEFELQPVFQQIMQVLTFLHANQIVHGNLTAQSVLVQTNVHGHTRAFLSGMGFVSALPTAAPHLLALAPDGRAPPVGACTAPELVSGQAAPTAKSDLWSVGILLFKAVFGPDCEPLAVAPHVHIPEHGNQWLVDLLASLLMVDPAARPEAGMVGVHSFFLVNGLAQEAANRNILTSDEKIQLFRDALRTMRRVDDMKMLRLRRESIVPDVLNDVKHFKKRDMLKTLNVYFLNEEGVDLDGLQKDMFSAFFQQVVTYRLPPKEGQAEGDLLFESENGQSYLPNPRCRKLALFQAIGKLLLKALLDERTIPRVFSPSLAKFLIDPDHVPQREDLEAHDPALLSQLRQHVLHTNVTPEYADMAGLTFEGLPGKENSTEPVTEQNKAEYVQLKLQQRLIEDRRDQLRALSVGFHVLDHPSELQRFNHTDLTNCLSGPASVTAKMVLESVDFNWQAERWTSCKTLDHVRRYIQERGTGRPAPGRAQLRQFIQFITGSPNLPYGGLTGSEALPLIKFNWAPASERMPESHTCFNTCDLPAYPSYDVLAAKFDEAILNAGAGFGLA